MTASLKEATIARKAFDYMPLLETGELRDSIKWNADETEGYVGADNEKVKWHEFGTTKDTGAAVSGIGALSQ